MMHWCNHYIQSWKMREERSWEKLRKNLRSVYVENQFLKKDKLCHQCFKRGLSSPRKAVCRCRDCGSSQFLCIECATEVHKTSNMFHVLDLWKDGMFVPMFPSNFVIVAPGHEKCGSHKDIKSIVFIDMQGRQHIKQMMFCSCQSEAEALVSVGFWPGSADKPVTAFDIKLLSMLSDLLLECHCSLDKLCATISLWKGSLLPSYVKNIYRILNNSTFDEFRYFRYAVGFQEESCTLCPKPSSNGTLIESMDACFGFVRKKSAGCSLNPPKYGTCMFADQSDVDNFVEKHSKEVKKSENHCSQYKAGEITECIRSKGRNERYDEKAVFGRICRHGFPKGFISVKHGERVAYAVYELKRMIEPFVNSENVKLKCMYDIACILDKHIQNNMDTYGFGEHISRVEFGIPIFHAYVHVSKCQMAYSPRQVKGFGLTDGEGIERLWSYLRKFCFMTKEMTAARRTDILTEALLHYARRINRNQGRYLATNMKKAQDLKEKTSAELQEMTTHLAAGNKITSETIKEWKIELQKLVSSKPAAPQLASSWKIEYARLLWQHFQLRNSISLSNVSDPENHPKGLIAKARQIEENLKKIERRNNVNKRWKINDKEFFAAMEIIENERRNVFLQKLYSMSVERHLKLMLKQRYSIGQKQAVRLARLVTQQTTKMKMELSKYNAQLSVVKEHFTLNQQSITFDDAKDTRSKLYSEFNFEKPSKESVSFYEKKRITELVDLLERCEEEVDLLKNEATTLFSSKIEKIALIRENIARHSNEEDSFSQGFAALLGSHRMQIEQEILNDRDMFRSFGIEVPTTIRSPDYEHLANVMYHEQINFESDEDDETSYEDSDSDNDIDCTFSD